MDRFEVEEAHQEYVDGLRADHVCEFLINDEDFTHFLGRNRGKLVPGESFTLWCERILNFNRNIGLNIRVMVNTVGGSMGELGNFFIHDFVETGFPWGLFLSRRVVPVIFEGEPIPEGGLCVVYRSRLYDRTRFSDGDYFDTVKRAEGFYLRIPNKYVDDAS